MALSRSRSSRSPSPRRRRSPAYSRSPSRSRSPRRRSYSRSPRLERERSLSPVRARSRSPVTAKGNGVLVTNLTRNVTSEHVREIFSQYGTIVELDFPFNKRLNANSGKAYVYYETDEEAKKAISHMDGGQLDGKHLTCEVAPVRLPSPPPAPRHVVVAHLA
ncbi:hypothetical protein CLU79DRAFT_382588 [Phycomyces nitens]|nr:hypothetical protein CLU79DRAFT_382588 [Phycomyces nitens]